MKKIIACLMLILTIFTLTSCDAYYEWAEQFNKLNGGNYAIPEQITDKDKMPLKVLYPNSSMGDAFNNSWTKGYFERITGYEVTYDQTLGDAASTITNILAAGEPYHMLKLEAGNYLGMVSDGTFTNLKPALEKYGQNLLKVIPQEAWDAVTTEDGKILAIPETGFSGMLGNALVWNMDHLKKVGITKVPETITEVNEAFYKLKETSWEGKTSKHFAFSTTTAQAYIPTLAAAWDIPQNFFVDENNEVKHIIYHPNYKKYTGWLNKLVRDGVMPDSWEGYTHSNLISEFAKGNLSCAYLSYYHINSLAKKYNSTQKLKDEEKARAILDWSVFVRGDGGLGTPVQEKAKYVSYQTIGYYCTVPIHMSQYTPYVVDWMDKRITEEAFEGYRLGDEGVHYNVVDSSNPNAIKVNLSSGEKYIELTEKYNADILPTSMYQTGVNPKVGTELWKLSEISYRAWEVLIENETPEALGNALGMTPYIPGWSELDIAARSSIITYEQAMINSATDADFEAEYNAMVDNWVKSFWTKSVNDNVQSWYKSTLEKAGE